VLERASFKALEDDAAKAKEHKDDFVDQQSA
jgi:hypothetical protein